MGHMWLDHRSKNLKEGSSKATKSFLKKKKPLMKIVIRWQDKIHFSQNALTCVLFFIVGIY